ncbi:MAG TPA: cobyrinate a,c-diamide synthase [Burkholderiaceae bacterium]
MVNPHICRVVLISAIASGQGKTTLTAAVARKLANEGKRVRVFKTGPDFLDPMLLERACGAPVHTLDLWMVGKEQCAIMLSLAAREADFILIEGVMGLYDGEPSSADLARLFNVPVVLIIDAAAMAQTVGAIVCGLRDYGPVSVAGVIANRVGSEGHAAMVAKSLRDVSLLGRMPRQERSLPERYLGLLPPEEVSELESLLEQLGQHLILDADAWQALPAYEGGPFEPEQTDGHTQLLKGKTIAIARDAAFAFLYPANLDCLRSMGATLKFFSPMADEAVPAEADGIYLPGGYPELHGAALSRAERWQASIRQCHLEERPIWAECGGMMTLSESLIDQSGTAWKMAGVLPGTARMQHRLAGLGAQSVATRAGHLRGHTFHYSVFDTALVAWGTARKNPSGADGESLYCYGSAAASYFHAYFPSCPEAAAALFDGARKGQDLFVSSV